MCNEVPSLIGGFVFIDDVLIYKHKLITKYNDDLIQNIQLYITQELIRKHNNNYYHNITYNQDTLILLTKKNNLICCLIITNHNNINQEKLKYKILPILNDIQKQIHNYCHNIINFPEYLFKIKCYTLYNESIYKFYIKEYLLNYLCCCIKLCKSNQYSMLQYPMIEMEKDTNESNITINNNNESKTPDKRDSLHLETSPYKMLTKNIFEFTQNNNDDIKLERLDKNTKTSGYDYLFKLVMVGDTGVGKSCILMRFGDNKYNDDCESTIGVDFIVRTVIIDGKIIKLQIWDTAGQKRFQTITQAYYRGAHGIIIVYDTTNEASFNSINEYLYQIDNATNDSTIRLIVGSKCDNKEERKVSFSDAQSFAYDLGFDIMEVSAKNNINIDKMIYNICCQIKGNIVKQAAKPRMEVTISAMKASVPGRHQREVVKTDKKLVDNIFTDLENLFYILASIVYMCRFVCKYRHKFAEMCGIILKNIAKFIGMFVVYPVIIIICLVIVLPSCIFLLIVRMSTIEVDTTKLDERETVLESETCCQRFLRLLYQLCRSIFMFIFIVMYPIFIIKFIIPKYNNYHNNVSLIFIGSYLLLILFLQIFGTIRGIKSYYIKKRHKLKNDRTHCQQPFKFVWNIGSIISLLLLFYEIFQLTLFAYYILNSNNSDTSNDASNDNEMDGDIPKFMKHIIDVFYLATNFLNDNILDYNLYFSCFFIGLLMLIFLYRIIYELNMYAKFKYYLNNKEAAQNAYFYSFIGCVIYGHGSLKNVSKITSVVISILSNSLFLPVTQKLILILSCNDDNKLIIDTNVTCWTDKHQLYALISLILIGYYVPLSSMISPIFDEIITKETNNKCISFVDTIIFLKPFLSLIVVFKFIMLICSSLIVNKNLIVYFIIIQAIIMLIFCLIILKWSMNNIKSNGLLNCEPCFPFSISILKCIGFLSGFFGCIIELIKYYHPSNTFINNNHFITLIISILASTFIGFIIWISIQNKFKSFTSINKNTNIIQYINNKMNIIDYNQFNQDRSRY